MSDMPHEHVVDRRDGDTSITLYELLQLTWRRRWYLILSASLAVAVGLIYLSQVTPVCYIEARVLVKQQGVAPKRFDQEFLLTQAQILASPVIVRDAVQSLSLAPQGTPDADALAEILEALTVSPVRGADVLTVEFKSIDPERGIRIVDALINSYKKYTHEETLRLLAADGDTPRINDELWRTQIRAKELTQKYGNKHPEVQAVEAQVALLEKLLLERQLADQALVESSAANSARLLQAPALAPGPVWTRPNLFLALCVAVGLTGGLAMIHLLERLDQKILSPEQVQRQIGLPVLGHIPVMRATSAGNEEAIHRGRLANESPDSPVAEAFRAIRTRLHVSTETPRGVVIQLVSPTIGEGKTALTANLAFSFAQLGRRVVVVDADLRRGSLHEILDVPSTRGLSSVLAEHVPVREAVERSPLAPVDVVTRGPDVSNPAELLAQPGFQRTLESLQRNYDIVLVDTPALLVVSDASAIAPLADAVILVLMAGRSSVAQAARANELLHSIGAKTIGALVNAIQPSRRYGYDFRYYGRRPNGNHVSRPPVAQSAARASELAELPSDPTADSVRMT